MSEKIKIRPLAVIAGSLSCVWGAVVAVKGLYDAFWGQPEANYFSSRPWEFVSRSQWYTWSSFEIVYGTVCILLALWLWRIARALPEYIERGISPQDHPL